MENSDLKDLMILPLDEKDIQRICNKITENPEVFLKNDFADSYAERLRNWHIYLSTFKSLLGFFSSLKNEGSSLKELIAKGYIE